ncbi:molybdopterin molybdotransferase MoeA [Paucibacter sediminis]|uniref:Molybdopterin molybdenumtransferase n=1 Tax=Paucibacter sediminis TaxID=3019553 RepID=A0AA95SMK0_9BURK|nr:gephyrin-like molybdotransferase Glp [Paucibacter sp. S2-9]WIT11497.1 molybdopterin molybdotransferase MoeA [Paucibacter sp. S2-9]
MSDPQAPRAPLQSLDEALARLLGRVAPLAVTETLPTAAALGRVLALPVVSQLDVPPADNTAMDGYALRAADLLARPGTALPVSQRVPAGVVGAVLEPGTAARIFTGAQIPLGADAVVMQEQCEAVAAAAGLGQVRIHAEVRPGQWIRRRGEDVQAGAVVLPAGARLNAASLGLAASVGAATLTLARRPRVALFSTGDELQMPGELLKPGAIYNSNRFTLTALLQGLGCEVVDLGIVPDRLDATRAALREAAEGVNKADLIITSGGVSVGEEDHLKPAVQAEGELDLWQIAIKPGKPLAFGKVRDAWFIGLPGNPVSSFVTFLLLVRPVILRLQGASELTPRRYPLRADFAWPRPDKRREFLRARINEQGGLALFPNQSSGVLTSAVWGEGLVDNPAGAAIADGATVQFIPFSELLHP